MATLLSPVDEVTKLRIAPAIANVKYAQLPDRSVKPATANVKHP